MAVWGLAIAISLASVWDRPAPPGQLPGLATKLNFDAHGPFQWVAGMMLLPVLVPLVLRPLLRLLARDDTRAWAYRTALVAPLIELWFVTITRSPRWAILPCAVTLAALVLLRRFDARFTRHDFVLLPVFLTTMLALIDRLPTVGIDRIVVMTALLVLALRLAVARIPSPSSKQQPATSNFVPPALAFAAVPLALVLQTNLFSRDQRHLGWSVLAIVVITPFVLRIVLRDRRRAAAALAFAIYPLALFAYMNVTNLQTGEGKPRISFFEEGHPLLPASEYLRGELPYRDILPAHGLLEDGFFDYLVLRFREPTVGNAMRARFLVGCLNAIAMYALVFAMTASAEAALLAVLFALSGGLLNPVVRMLPPLIALTFIALAVRRRQPRWFAWAGFFTVVCGTTSLDFAFYTFATLVIALVRYGYGGQAILPVASRSRQAGLPVLHWKKAAIGITAGVVPLFGGYALFGILDDFFRGTFVEVLTLGPVYVLTMFNPPEGFKKINGIPELLVAVFDRSSLLYVLWVVIAIFAGVFATRRVPRRIEPLVLAALWVVLAAISYAERQHLYFYWLVPPFLVGGTWLLARRRHPFAPVAILLLIILAGPTTHLAITNWVRRTRGPIDATWREMPGIARARGGLYRNYDVEVMASVQKYFALTLAPDETFFDFTNRGLIYFLLRRDCPIRYYEVAFYETEERQRAVIAALEANPKVKAALIPGPIGAYPVDGVPNRERAPLVWQYLQENFVPDFEEGDVVFWRRKPEGAPVSGRPLGDGG